MISRTASNSSPVRVGHAVEVEERDRLVAGVVHRRRRKPSRPGSVSPRCGERLPDARIVEDLRDGPGVRAAPRRRRRRSRGPTRAGCSGWSSRGRRSAPAGRSRDVRPMSRSTRSAMSVISSSVKPTWPSSGPGVGSVRSSCSRVVGGVWTNPPSRWRIRAVSRGKRVRGDQRDRGQDADRGGEERARRRRTGCRCGTGARPSPGCAASCPAAGAFLGCRRPPRRPSAGAGSRPGRAARSGRRPPPR